MDGRRFHVDSFWLYVYTFYVYMHAYKFPISEIYMHAYRRKTYKHIDFSHFLMSIHVYVDSYIARNTLSVRGFPIMEYESLPVHISMGNSHTDMESRFIGGLLATLSHVFFL